MLITWLPHAGQTELTQVALAIWGMYANLRLLVEVSIDAVVARRDDPSDDTSHLARAAVRQQVVLALIQGMVLATGVSSLFLPPPPPMRFSEMWLSFDPRGVMWVVQHVGLVLTTILCVVGAHLAGRERQRILRPQQAQKEARKAVRAGQMVGGTLLDQVGGHVAIAAIVADLYARIVRDPVLCVYFANSTVDVKHLEHAQAAMLEKILTDQPPGIDLRAAHAQLSIPDAHFTRLAEHLKDSLQFFGVSHPLGEQILARVETTRELIVTPALRPVDGDVA